MDNIRNKYSSIQQAATIAGVTEKELQSMTENGILSVTNGRIDTEQLYTFMSKGVMFRPDIFNREKLEAAAKEKEKQRLDRLAEIQTELASIDPDYRHNGLESLPEFEGYDLIKFKARKRKELKI